MCTFTEALQNNDIEKVRNCPKADIHNHFVLGGDREYIEQMTKIHIDPITRPLASMREMDAWSAKYIGSDFETTEMRK